VLRVHRLGVGSRLSLFNPESALEAEALVVGAGRGRLECEVEDVRASSYRAHPIELLQALGKGDKAERCIRDATALGVQSIALIQSERSVVQLDAVRAQGRRTRWQRIAVDAARQCQRGNLPSITGPLPLGQALGLARAGVRLVLSPGAPPLLKRLGESGAEQAVALLVGPEGGLSAAELGLAGQLGFVAVSLGGTILRTELAGIAALGALVAWQERIE
jgi:16S rRNA (uracil1498-N3)-methyltransferase